MTNSEFDVTDLFTCWHPQCETVEQVQGTPPGDVSVTTCVDEIYQPEDTSDFDADDVFGFEPGATVVLGLVPMERQPSGFRYAVPTCWGYLHDRPDQFSESESTDLLSIITEATQNRDYSVSGFT